MSPLAPSLEAFFTDRLASQRAASQNTIAANGLTFRLLLQFTSARSGIPPSKLDIADLDAPLVAALLEHLERERGNATTTRNARLAAIHSLFSYLALHHPEHAGSVRRVLSIPNKRTEVNLVAYLNETRRPCSSRRAISDVGLADAITQCSLSRSRPGFGSPSSSDALWSDDVSTSPTCRIRRGGACFGTLTAIEASVRMQIEEASGPDAQAECDDALEDQDRIVRTALAEFIVDLPVTTEEVFAQADSDDWLPLAGAAPITRASWWAWRQDPIADLLHIYGGVARTSP